MAEAEGVRRIKLAQGEAQAVRDVFGAIHDGDPTPDLISIRYLEALKAIADGRVTKVFLPTEMSGLFGTVGGLAELLRQPPDGEDESPGRGPAKRRTEERLEEEGGRV